MLASTGSSQPGGGAVPPVEMALVFCDCGCGGVLPSLTAGVGRTGWRMMVDSEIDSLTARAYSARREAGKAPAEAKRWSGAWAIERDTIGWYLAQRCDGSASDGGTGSW